MHVLIGIAVITLQLSAVALLPYYTPKVKDIHVVLLLTCIAVIALSLSAVMSSSSALLYTHDEI